MVAPRHFTVLMISLFTGCALMLAACEPSPGIQAGPSPSPDATASLEAPAPSPTPSTGNVQPIITF